MLTHYILRGKEPVEVTRAEWVKWCEAFKVVDTEGQDVAYVYYRPPGTAPIGTGGLAARMSKETARRMAAQIARLPELLGKS